MRGSPSLPGWIAACILVIVKSIPPGAPSGKFCTTQSFAQGFVSAVVEQRELQADIQVHGAHMVVTLDFVLIDDQRRNQTADDHEFVHQVTEPCRNRQAGRANAIAVRKRVSERTMWFFSHGLPLRSSVRADVLRPRAHVRDDPSDPSRPGRGAHTARHVASARL
jgi:hypothetical protein